MSLGADFRHRELVQRPAEERLQSSILKARSLRHRGGGGHHGPRRVATLRGSKVFGQPIGTIITRDMIESAQRKGKLRAGEDPNTGGRLKGGGRQLANANLPGQPPVARAARQAGAGKGRISGLPDRGVRGKPRVKPVEPNNPHAQRVADYRNRMQAAKHEDDLIGIVEDLQGDSIINTKAYDALLDEIAARADHLSTPKPTETAPKKPAPKQAAPKAGMPTNAREKARGRVQQVPAPAQKPRQAGPDTRQRGMDAEKRLNALIQNAPDTVAEGRAKQAIVRAHRNKEINDQQFHHLLGVVDANRGARQAAKPKKKPHEVYMDRAKKAMDEDALAQVVEDADNDDGLSASEFEAVLVVVEDRAAAIAGGAAARNQQAEEDAKREKRRKAVRNLKDQADAAHTSELATGGALRQAAKDNSAFNTKDKANIDAVLDNVKIQRALDKIAKAQNEATLMQIAQKVDAEDHWSVAEKEKIFEALSDRMKAIHSPKDRLYRSKAGHKSKKERPHDPNWKGTPDESPAGKALAKGAKIEDLQDPTGLIDYLQAHPERFDVSINDDGQASQVMFVTDKKARKEYFFKNTSNNGDADMFGDGMNEVMAAKLGRAAFPDLFPDVNFAGRPEGGQNAWIRMDHVREHAAPGDEWADVRPNAKDRWAGIFGAQLRGKPAKDPRQPLAIHIFDYLIDQTDRHLMNYGFMDTPKGAVLIPLDNGGAFHAYEAQYYAQAYGKEVEDINYNEWKRNLPKRLGHPYRAEKISMMMEETRESYRANGWGRDKLAADVKAIVGQYAKTDLDAIIADLERRFPNMDEYERQHMVGAANIWRSRMALLSVDDIVKGIGL